MEKNAYGEDVEKEYMDNGEIWEHHYKDGKKIRGIIRGPDGKCVWAQEYDEYGNITSTWIG